jgi:hypothetical protein
VSAAKTEFERSCAISRRKFAVAIGHDRNSEQFCMWAGCGDGAIWGRPFSSTHRPFVSEFRSLLLIFLVATFVSVLVIAGRPRRKSTKVLSLANCGMGAAVDSGVIRAHVLGFLSVPLARWLRLWGAHLFTKALGIIGSPRQSGSSSGSVG